MKKHLLILLLLGCALFVTGYDSFVKEQNQYGKNLALKKTYRWNIAPNAFPSGYAGDSMCKDENDKRQLTDGRFANNCWFDVRTVGWWKEGEFINITIDLEKEEKIGTVAIRCSSEKEGLRVPVEVRVFVSNSDHEFSLVGRSNRFQNLKSWNRTQAPEALNPHGWVILQNYYEHGRYVTVSMLSSALYIDEIVVFSEGGKSRAEGTQDSITYPTCDITPFYALSKGYIAKELISPMNLINRNGGYDLTVEMPSGIDLVNLNAKTLESETHIDKKTHRKKVMGVDALFFRSSLKLGEKAIVTLTEDVTQRKQLIEMETISVPKVEPFKKVLTSVSFAEFRYWEQWPDAPKHYAATGLNLFMPFSGTDYWYLMYKNKNPKVQEILEDARKIGLKIGGNYSPFCNIQINGASVKRSAVYLKNNGTSNVNCPRTYDNQEDYVAIREAGNAGLNYLWLDSEPFWSGDICRCKVCEKLWLDFQKKQNLSLGSLKEIFTKSDKDAHSKVQEFWDEFYIELWTKIKQFAPRAKTSLYGSPSQHSAFTFGNKGLFKPLFLAGAVDYGAASLYFCPTEEYGKAVRNVKKQLQEINAPGFLWMTCGGGNLTFERTHADLRNRLYIALFSGMQGFTFWSARGVDAKEYQIMGSVIQALTPYEDVIVNGKLLPEIMVKSGYGNASVNILDNGKKALLLVEFFEEASREFKIPLPSGILDVRNVTHENATWSWSTSASTLTVTVGGTEENRVIGFILEKE